MASKTGLGISIFILAQAAFMGLDGLFVLRDDIPMFPTYYSIVVDLSRVQKHIVCYEQVVPFERVRADFVRIVDIAGSPPRSTDKGIAGCYVPAGDKDIYEPTYSC